MARRGVTGQLNMFDLFREIEAMSPQAGDLQMVSLVPDEEADEPVIPEEVVAETFEEAEEETFEEVEDEETLEEVEDEKSLEEVKEEETLEVTEEKSCDEKVAMSRTYHTKEGFLKIDYINYNKVRICKSGQPDEVKVFESSKEAVDFYVEQMQRFEEIYGEA